MGDATGWSILSSPALVFDFGRQTVHDDDGTTMGRVAAEGRALVCRDHDGQVVWMVEGAGPFQASTRVLDAEREEIGTLAVNRLSAGAEPFATLVKVGRSELEVRDDAGEVLAHLRNLSRLWSFHQRVRIEVQPFVHAAERLVVLATVCVFEASATLD